MAGLLGIKTYEYNGSSNNIELPIDVNAGYSGIKAFLYLVSYHASGGNNTYYEFGCIRCGYSDNYVERTIISARSGSGIASSVSVSSNGKVMLNFASTSTPNKHVIIVG